MTDSRAVLLLVLGLVASDWGGAPRVSFPSAGPSDPHATARTRALFANLREVARDHVLFGHQDDLAYGVSWWDEPGRSDVRESAGSYPAVFGWELGWLESGGATSLDKVRFDRIRLWMVDAYEMGGVNTASWHLNNPVSGGSAWDTSSAVAAILPGGPQHPKYVAWLDRLGAFFGSVRTADGEPVPIIFRPFHEMGGGWFWWGRGHATPEDYRALWRFTVEYVRDYKGVHNLLWAYSPNGLRDVGRDGYWTWYPGDDYVDVIGFDDYSTLEPGSRGNDVAGMAADLAWLVARAGEHGKIPALTETGYQGIPDSTWWTTRLLAAITADPGAAGIAWVLVWRNANAELDRAGHYFAPYAGHPSAADFARFRNHPLILFADELPDLYRASPDSTVTH